MTNLGPGNRTNLGNAGPNNDNICKVKLDWTRKHLLLLNDSRCNVETSKSRQLAIWERLVSTKKYQQLEYLHAKMKLDQETIVIFLKIAKDTRKAIIVATKSLKSECD